MFRPLLPSIALVLLGACTEYATTSDTTPRASTGQGYEGPWRIDQVARACTEGDSDRWEFEVRTEGWAEQVNLHVAAPAEGQDTGTEPLAALEIHPLENVDWGDDGSWDKWEVVLLTVSDPIEVQPGATTRWGCEHAPDEGGSLAWMATMYRAGHPDQMADCAVWGARAADLHRADCQCLDADDDCTN